jgi:hypothetical protein
MRVEMLVSISGTRDGVEWPRRGGIVDVPDVEAADLIAASLAVAAPADVETAAEPAGDVETAALDTRPRRR